MKDKLPTLGSISLPTHGAGVLAEYKLDSVVQEYTWSELARFIHRTRKEIEAWSACLFDEKVALLCWNFQNGSYVGFAMLHQAEDDPKMEYYDTNPHEWRKGFVEQFIANNRNYFDDIVRWRKPAPSFIDRIRQRRDYKDAKIKFGMSAEILAFSDSLTTEYKEDSSQQ